MRVACISSDTFNLVKPWVALHATTPTVCIYIVCPNPPIAHAVHSNRQGTTYPWILATMACRCHTDSAVWASGCLANHIHSMSSLLLLKCNGQALFVLPLAATERNASSQVLLELLHVCCCALLLLMAINNCYSCLHALCHTICYPDVQLLLPDTRFTYQVFRYWRIRKCDVLAPAASLIFLLLLFCQRYMHITWLILLSMLNSRPAAGCFQQ